MVCEKIERIFIVLFNIGYDIYVGINVIVYIDIKFLVKPKSISVLN